MLGMIICLAILLALNITLFIKSKNYLNLFASIILTFTIVYSCHSYKKAHSANTEIEKEIEENIEEKESELEILGVSMECPKCGRKLWSDDKFCADCGYEKDISDFGKNARDYILYNCPKCEKLNSSKRNFCSYCGENLTELNKIINESVSAR